MDNNVQLSEKYCLTMNEAVVLFNINEKKLRQMTDEADCPFVLWNGSKRLIKKDRFAKYIDDQYSI